MARRGRFWCLSTATSRLPTASSSSPTRRPSIAGCRLLSALPMGWSSTTSGRTAGSLRSCHPHRTSWALGRSRTAPSRAGISDSGSERGCCTRSSRTSHALASGASSEMER
eukprot:3284493-Rhodomonas_salina.1